MGMDSQQTGFSFLDLLNSVENRPIGDVHFIDGHTHHYGGSRIDAEDFSGQKVMEANFEMPDFLSIHEDEPSLAIPQNTEEDLCDGFEDDDAFYTKYSNQCNSFSNDSATASVTSRSYSTFYQSDAESTPKEKFEDNATSREKNDPQPPDDKDETGKLYGPFEDSVRKYCANKTHVMFKPEVGMEFDSCEDGYKFYNMYSWVLGFSIRCGDNYTNKKGKRTVQEYRCQREGGNKDAKMSTTRCGCKALLRLACSDNSKWYVKAFIEDHNHQLVASCGEKKHLSSHRNIDSYTKDWIRHLRENNVSLSRVNIILGSVFGSMDSVPFTKKTLRTFCSNIASDALKDDVRKTLESFREMISKDSRFVFAAQLDENDRLKSLMWSSGKSRYLYEHFGDVVTFDTTYETNIYKMPFGMFVGVNNHFQSVIFAGVLLTNETHEDFKWAFQEFVAMMGGKAPVTMLTDQCKAMSIAIKENLKTTAHRWCKWHVLKRAHEALCHVHKKHKSFAGDFNKVVNHMLTIEEFETAWAFMIAKYDLAENPFLIRAYQVRQKWAKPYFKNIFCARMSSTQRSESANHVLKIYVPSKSPINLFVKQYTKLIDDREKEDDEVEKNSSQRSTETLVGFPIEKHAAEIYTSSVFKLFKTELKKAASFVVVDKNGDNVFMVKHVDADNRDSWSKVTFIIQINHAIGEYKCECGLFEHFGVICCHIILVMIHTGVMQIPDYHIMKRWTKYARDGSGKNSRFLSMENQSAVDLSVRHKMLYMAALDLISIVQYDDSTCKLALEGITAYKKKIAAYKSTISTTCQIGYNLQGEIGSDCGPDASLSADSVDSSTKSMRIFDKNKNVGIDVCNIKAPDIKRKTGRPSNKRIFGHFDSNVRRKEKSVEQTYDKNVPGGRTGVHQTRFCSKCKSPSHNKRTCPEMAQDSVVKRKKTNS